MSWEILFAMLCTVIAFNILVVFIAIRNAYRQERKTRHFSPQVGPARSGLAGYGALNLNSYLSTRTVH